MASSILTSETGVEKLGEEKLSLKDKSIHLSIEFRENQLLTTILDKYSNQYLAWTNFPINDKELSLNAVIKDELFSFSPSSVSIVLTKNSSILVPSLYFKKEALNSYLITQALNKPEETPCYDYIKNLDSYNLYTVNKSFYILRDKYPSAVLRHHISIFLEYILIENKNSQEDNVYVCIFPNYMDVAVLQLGKLTLSNRFYFENSNDFIYHLLWVYEQIGLNTEKTACTFYGEVEKNSDICKLSLKYIKKLKLGDRNEKATYSIPLNSLSPHKYRSLFTQYLCI